MFETAERLLIPGLGALAFLGIAMVRSAYLQRQGNWIVGLILGAVFCADGTVGRPSREPPCPPDTDDVLWIEWR